MNASESGIEGHEQHALVPLMGRRTEFRALMLEFERADRTPSGVVATLVGPIGSGKSRLLKEVEIAIRSHDSTPRVLRATGADRERNLIGQLIAARFHFEERDSRETVGEKLSAGVRSIFGDAEFIDARHALGQFVGLDLESSFMTRAADEAGVGSALRGRVFAQLLARDASVAPVCVIIDDAHLADSDSLAALRTAVRGDGRIFLLLAGQPELGFGEVDAPRRFPGEKRFELGPLYAAEYQDLIRALLGPCEPKWRRELAYRIGGVAIGYPGSAASMVQFLFERGVLVAEDGGIWKVDPSKLESTALPIPVSDRVAARHFGLDSLERRVVRAAAAMGSTFWQGAVLCALRAADANGDVVSQSSVDGALERLSGSDYIVELSSSQIAGERQFAFADRVERDYVSALTSPARRRALNRALGAWLDQKTEPREQHDLCALRAHHHERGGNLAGAATAFLDAADIARSAHCPVEAEGWYRAGLALLSDLEPRRRIEALHHHGDVLSLLGRNAEAIVAFDEMRDLANQLCLPRKSAAAAERLARIYRHTGDLASSETCLKAALVAFTAALDDRGVAAVHDDLGQIMYLRGDYEQALQHLDFSLGIRRAIGDKRSIALSLDNIGKVRVEQGQDDEAEKCLSAALVLRRAVDDKPGIVQSLCDLARVAKNRADHEVALTLLDECHRLATEIGMTSAVPSILVGLGETHRRLGHSKKAIELLSQAVALAERTDDLAGSVAAYRGLAKAYLTERDVARARQMIRIAAKSCAKLRRRADLARVMRTLGEVAAAGGWGGRHEAAVPYFMRSIQLFKELGNELAVAKGYRAFARYASSRPYHANQQIQAKAREVEALAEEVFKRHRSTPVPAPDSGVSFLEQNVISA
jgi:tetratricopeptide (TPR) repeat protein